MAALCKGALQRCTIIRGCGTSSWLWRRTGVGVMTMGCSTPSCVSHRWLSRSLHHCTVTDSRRRVLMSCTGLQLARTALPWGQQCTCIFVCVCVCVCVYVCTHDRTRVFFRSVHVYSDSGHTKPIISQVHTGCTRTTEWYNGLSYSIVCQCLSTCQTTISSRRSQECIFGTRLYYNNQS